MTTVIRLIRSTTLAAAAILTGSAVHAGEAAPSPVQLPEQPPVQPPAAQAGEEKPKEEGKEPASDPDRYLFDLIAGIPAVPLADDVLLQSGELTVTTRVVERTETAYLAGERRRAPKFSPHPEALLLIRKKFAFQHFCNLLLEKYIADNKLTMPQADFDASFAAIQDAYRQQAGSYEQWLADNGLADEQFRKTSYAIMTVKYILNQQLTEAEIEAAFNAHKDGLAARRARHMLIAYKGAERAPLSLTRTKEQALALATAAQKRLAAGTDIETVARETEGFPNSVLLDDTGFFPRHGALTGAFADAVYALEKVGDVAPAPVETAYGYHVIRLAGLRDSTSLRVDVRRALASEKANKLLRTLLEEAAKNARFNEKYLPAQVRIDGGKRQ